MAARPRPAREGFLRNLAWLTAGNVAAKPLWFLFITAACTRVLGAAEYGTLIASLALVGLVVSFTELGTNDYATRELARRPEAGARLFTNLLAGRAVLGLLAVGLLPLLSLLGYETHEATALMVAGFYTVAFRLNELARALYRAAEVLRYEAVSLFTERLIVVGTGAAGLVLTRTAMGTLAGMTAGMVASLALNACWIHVRLHPLRRTFVRLRPLAAAYAAALPLGVLGLFAIGLNVCGIVLVEAIAGNAEAGRYGAAYKLLEMLMLFPGIVCAPLFPRLSYLRHHGTAEAFRAILLRSALSITGLAVALAGALSLAAPLVVRLLAAGDAFEGTAAILRVLIWAHPLMALGMLLTYALIAADYPRYAAALTAVAAAVAAAVTYALVPSQGALGAAVGLIAAHALAVAGASVGLARAVRRRATAAPDAPSGPVSLLAQDVE